MGHLVPSCKRLCRLRPPRGRTAPAGAVDRVSCTRALSAPRCPHPSPVFVHPLEGALRVLLDDSVRDLLLESHDPAEFGGVRKVEAVRELPIELLIHGLDEGPKDGLQEVVSRRSEDGQVELLVGVEIRIELPSLGQAAQPWQDTRSRTTSSSVRWLAARLATGGSRRPRTWTISTQLSSFSRRIRNSRSADRPGLQT